MQIKYTMRYHCTTIRMANKKVVTILNASKDAEKLNLSYTVGGNVKCHNNSGKYFGSIFKKLNIYLQFNPATFCLDTYPQK